MTFRYGSVCSGIEAWSLAVHDFGWEASFFSEIAEFPRRVLAQRWPDVPLHGDFTTIQDGDYAPIDLLVGGTPCQSFSIAGLRAGLEDELGNLSLEYCRLAQRLRPCWLVWENVPGVLSIDGGRAFGSILGAMGKLGYGVAYRVLDAQYFGVPQRRRRVFVVGYLGDWRVAAKVLFEPESLRGDTAPCSEAEAAVAALTANGVGTCGVDDNQAQAGHLISSTGETAHCLNAGGMGRQDFETETLIAYPLRARAQLAHDPTLDTYVTHALRGAEGFDASEDGTGRSVPLIPIAFDCKAFGRNGFGIGEISPTLRAMGHADTHQNAGGQVAVMLPTEGGSPATDYAVRRLTPLECERLQGIPDGHTRIFSRRYKRANITGRRPADMWEPDTETGGWRLMAADGPRYKSIGNSKAVPVVRWLAGRIKAFEEGWL